MIRVCNTYRVVLQIFGQFDLISRRHSAEREEEGQHNPLARLYGRRQGSVIVESFFSFLQCIIYLAKLSILRLPCFPFKLLEDILHLPQSLIGVAFRIEEVDADHLGVVILKRIDHLCDVASRPWPAPHLSNAYVIDRHDRQRSRGGLCAKIYSEIVKAVFKSLDRGPPEPVGRDRQGHNDDPYDKFFADYVSDLFHSLTSF